MRNFAFRLVTLVLTGGLMVASLTGCSSEEIKTCQQYAELGDSSPLARPTSAQDDAVKAALKEIGADTLPDNVMKTELMIHTYCGVSKKKATKNADQKITEAIKDVKVTNR